MTHTNQAQGYLVDSPYVDRFLRELSPVWLNYVAVLHGVPPRDIERPFVYIDLGCGFGTSTVVNAGAFPSGRFYANDLNAAHVSAGRRHATELGLSNISFLETPFKDLLATDLPDFDFIVTHGVYSWIDEDARADVRSLIARKLKPGGLVYMSYNCLPGWATEAPLRKLLIELADTVQGTSALRARGAMNALQALNRHNLRYFASNPSAASAVEDFSRGRDNYLAHEFLNTTWAPSYSVDVAAEMVQAGLRFVGSATLADNHALLNVDAETVDSVHRLATVRQRQLAMDFAVNRRFRRDVFVRDVAAPIRSHICDIVIGCTSNPQAIGERHAVPRGEVAFQSEFVAELARVMVRGSMRLGEIVALLGGAGRDASTIARNLLLMVAAGGLAPFARVHRADASAVNPRTPTPLARRAVLRAVTRGVPCVIPSEILGNGIEITLDDAHALARWLDASSDTDRRVADELLARLDRLGAIG